MKTSSLKAKARVLQDKVREMYRDLGRQYGLVDDDIKAAPMGQSGVDTIFSPAGQAIFNHAIECKKHAAVRIPYFFKEHYQKYKDDSRLKLLFSENNRDQTLVTMRAEDFIEIVEELLEARNHFKNFSCERNK